MKSVLEKRVIETAEWLAENAPHCEVEQNHLDENTPERAYWHYGYLMAIRDVLSLLEPETQP